MFDFKTFLIENGWYYQDDTILTKGNFQISLKNNFFILFNNNKQVKYKHIATCKKPVSLTDAECIINHLLKL
jgi:hypothetical protein